MSAEAILHDDNEDNNSGTRFGDEYSLNYSNITVLIP